MDAVGDGRAYAARAAQPQGVDSRGTCSVDPGDPDHHCIARGCSVERTAAQSRVPRLTSGSDWETCGSRPAGSTQPESDIAQNLVGDAKRGAAPGTVFFCLRSRSQYGSGPTRSARKSTKLRTFGGRNFRLG